MIRAIKPADKAVYLEMAKEFYSTDAVISPVAEENFSTTFDEMMKSDRYAVGYIFELDGKTVGYALLAKTFSQEAGGMVIWIEELYIKDGFRSKGLGSEFFRFLESTYGGIKRFRLEVEKENTGAVRLYEKQGFSFFAYDQMIKEIK